MNNIYAFSTFLVFSMVSCLSPDKMMVTDDQDLNKIISLIELQPSLITNTTLEKEIQIGNKNERKTLNVDSSFFSGDFKILGGKDLGLIFLGGGYDKNTSEQTIEYNRKKSEKMGPLSLIISKSQDGKVLNFSLLEENQNILYQSQSTSSFSFDSNKMLTAYSIVGFQKLSGKDASSYSINGLIK